MFSVKVENDDKEIFLTLEDLLSREKKKIKFLAFVDFLP
jgi:hypothetical protein